MKNILNNSIEKINSKIEVMNNKIPKIIWIPSLIISILSIIPMYYIYTYIMDMAQLNDFNTIGAVKVDEIMSRNIHETKFLIPCIFIIIMMITQSIFSAIIIKNYKGWQNKCFAITNLFFGGIVISNIFLLFKFLKSKNIASAVKISSIGIGTISSIAVPAAIFALSMGTGSIDNPTHLSNIVMSNQKGQENVLEIFTDGFDPEKALPYFQNDPLFKDFISMDRMVTGGYTTEPSYTQMLGGVERDPYFLQKELNKEGGSSPVEGLNTESWNAYLHDNFMDSLLNRMKRDGFENAYIGNPDDDGHFKDYFQHVSGDPDKLIDRNKALNKADPSTKNNLKVYNWGQAKDETATAGVNPYQNNVVVYKWMENNIKVQNTGHGSRIFLQDSITHAPRVIAKDGSLSFAAVADSAKINQDVSFQAVHKVLSDLIRTLKAKGLLDNTLISIYGDHSDHSNTVPKVSDTMPDAPNSLYIKNFGQAIVKFPHTKENTSDRMVSNRTPFFGPNMGDLISDYFNQKSNYDNKTPQEVSDNISASLKKHVKNFNRFITTESNDEHYGSFVKWENPQSDEARLVPYTPAALVKRGSTKEDPENNWIKYKDFIEKPELETEIQDMGWK